MEQIRRENYKNARVVTSRVSVLDCSSGQIVLQICGKMSNDGGPYRNFVQSLVLGLRGDMYRVVSDVFRYVDSLWAKEKTETQVEKPLAKSSSVNEAVGDKVKLSKGAKNNKPAAVSLNLTIERKSEACRCYEKKNSSKEKNEEKPVETVVKVNSLAKKFEKKMPPVNEPSSLPSFSTWKYPDNSINLEKPFTNPKQAAYLPDKRSWAQIAGNREPKEQTPKVLETARNLMRKPLTVSKIKQIILVKILLNFILITTIILITYNQYFYT